MTLDQTGGGVISAADGSQITIAPSYGGLPLYVDEEGGTLSTTGSGVIVLKGVTLDGVTAPVRITGHVSTYHGPFFDQRYFDLKLAGSIDNSGLIAVTPDRPNRVDPYTPQLQIEAGVTLSGAGQIEVGEYGKLAAAAAGAVLTNIDNTITGVGQIGDGSLAIVNGAAGVIEATGAARQTLVLDIGSSPFTNAGLIEAVGAASLTVENGTLENDGEVSGSGAARITLSHALLDQGSTGALMIATVAHLDDAGVAGGTTTIAAHGLLVASGAANSSTLSGSVLNSGRIEVVGATLTVSGAVSGMGLGVIDGGLLAFTSSFEGRAQFLRGAGTLRLARSQSYTGAVFGFALNGKTAFDLTDIGFVGAGEASYSGTSAKGVLTVTDGTHTAQIHLVGDYLNATFTAASDGQGGTVITAGAAPGARAPSPALAAMHADQGVRAPVAAAAHGFAAVAAGLGVGGAAESRTAIETRAPSTCLGLARPAIA